MEVEKKFKWDGKDKQRRKELENWRIVLLVRCVTKDIWNLRDGEGWGSWGGWERGRGRGR